MVINLYNINIIQFNGSSKQNTIKHKDTDSIL